MESIGERLREARDDKGYSLEQVARDTHIAKRYITALEADDYELFPGEPYVIGFLKNYSEYLGLDAHEIQTRYNNIKLQEQPVPLDQLLDTNRSGRGRVVALIVAVVLVVAAIIGVFIFSNVGSTFASWFERSPAVSGQRGENGVGAEDSDPQERPVTGQNGVVGDTVLERAFFRGERFFVDVEGESVQLSLDEIGERVRVRYPGGAASIADGGFELLDLNSSGSPDIRVSVREVMLETSPPEAVLRLDRTVSGAAAEQPLPDIRADEVVSIPDTGSPGIGRRARDERTIRAAVQPGPFSVVLSASGMVLLRVRIDSSEAEQHVLESGNELSVNPEHYVVVSASNAGNLSATVDGTPVELGESGEVASMTIGYVDTDTSRPRLALVPTY